MKASPTRLAVPPGARLLHLKKSMKKFLSRIMFFATLAGASAMSHSQGAPQGAPLETRGELLYTTHCISCHTSQMHWRNDKQASDWDSLKVQVRRWQGNANLQWADADIADVARYLNDTIYHYPQTADRLSSASPPARP